MHVRKFYITEKARQAIKDQMTSLHESVDLDDLDKDVYSTDVFDTSGTILCELIDELEEVCSDPKEDLVPYIEVESRYRTFRGDVYSWGLDTNLLECDVEEI